jgi:hypothetical protein
MNARDNYRRDLHTQQRNRLERFSNGYCTNNTQPLNFT